MPKTSPYLIGFVLLVLLGGLYYVMNNQQFAVFTPQYSGMVQYHGTFVSGYEEWHKLVNPRASSEVKIFNYKIVTGSDTFKSDWGTACGLNWCNGASFMIDDKGCQVFKRTSWNNGAGCEFQECRNNGGSLDGCGYYTNRYYYDTFNYGSCQKIYTYCGNGSQVIDLNNYHQGCWGNFKIYKDNVLIKTIPDQVPGQGDIFTSRTGIVYELEPNVKFTFHTSDFFAYGGCQRIQNQLDFNIPPNSFDFNISTPKIFYFEGQEAKAEIVVTNNYRDVKGNLSVNYEIPTAIGSAQKQVSQIVTLPVGITTISYDVPTVKTTEIVKLTPNLKVLLDSSSFSGLNADCDPNDPGVDPVESCAYIPIGELTGDTFEVQIVPTPIYIETPSTGCPVNYELSKSTEGFCVKSDLKDLTCYQIGCPILDIGGKNISYECSSAGICVQKVFQQQQCLNDSYCASNEACDVGSGLCIEKIIFNNILQCQSASDCPNPCQGKTISCNAQNRCEYSGECSLSQITCREVGCAEGFTCNSGRGVCERTTTNIITEVSKGNNFWVYVALALAILLAFVLIKRKRR